MGVPLIVRDQVIGVIAVQSYTDGDTYSTEDLDILTAISHQTAIAIDRKRSLDELAQSKERMDFALQATSSGIWDWDIESQEIYFDDNHYIMGGYSPGEYASIKKEWSKRVHPEDLPGVEALLDMTRSGKLTNYRSEYRYLRKDGNWMWVLSQGKIVSWREDGTPSRFIGTHTDITKQKEAEEKLERSKKMEALGLLAGSVAHDLNNILAGIINYPELMLLELDQNSDLIRPLQAIQDSGKRAATVVNDLLTIARGAASIKEVQCLHAIIKKYVNSPEFLQYISDYPDIKIILNLEAEERNILCSPVHITKSLMNLVNNSIDAIGASGTLTISTTNSVTGFDDVVALKVHDTGTGVKPEDIKHIFEPFYTKKIMGKSGTGLGLAVVWNTMEDHHGEVFVESSPEGTTFSLVFPLSPLCPKSSTQSFDVAHYMGDGQRILIVDDEPQLLDIARKILESLNYTCITLGSGEEAISYLRNHSADLILLDMLMEPGINGRQTYEEIIKTHPGQKAVLASGYSNSSEVERAVKLGIGAFVKKPYTLEQLGTVIKEQFQNTDLTL